MHDKMKKPELSEICQIEKNLISALSAITSQGVLSKDVDGKELGELVDMVKDMAETKRNCWEACYYESVTKAMEEYSDPEMMGYNPNRYASGRYAPSGTGDMTMGYMPDFKMPMIMRPGTLWHDEGLMGYDGQNGQRSGNGRYRNNSYGYPNDNRYGNAYREYENARRHYTETRSLEDKNEMDGKAMEHVNQSMMTLRDIWKNADPEVKRNVASSISSLASEFKSV